MCNDFTAPSALWIQIVAEEGASIKDIVHERAWLVDAVAHVQVFMVRLHQYRQRLYPVLQHKIRARKGFFDGWVIYRCFGASSRYVLLDGISVSR